MLSMEELLDEISSQTGKSREKIKVMIKDKQEELSNLVTEEGAAYIVGRELGANLIREGQRKLKVGSIVPGMRSVDLTAKVISVMPVRHFDKNGKKGKVMNLMLADDTGSVRLPLWNDEVTAEREAIETGAVLGIKGAMAVEDNQGRLELRLGRGEIATGDESEMEGVVVSGIPAGGRKPASRMNISELKEGAYASVKACIVQIYKKKPFYTVCAECGSKAEGLCQSHPAAGIAAIPMISCVIDDGTDNIRAVFFRDAAVKVLGMQGNEAKAVFDEKGVEGFWEGFRGLGAEFIIEGRVKISDFTKEMEMMVSSVSDVDISAECSAVIEEIGNIKTDEKKKNSGEDSDDD